MLNHETVSEKADRLKTNYRVILTGPNQALVIGDHNTYQVAKKDCWSCDCKWGCFRAAWGRCSHVIAVQRALKDPSSQEPVPLLAQMLRGAL